MAVMGSAAGAQPLDAFLSSADKANFEVRTGVEARARAEAEFAQAWGALLPSITASGGWTHNQYAAQVTIPTGATTSSTIVITPIDQLDATLRAEVPLIDATRWLRTAASSASAAAAREREQVSREQARRQVISAFYSYLAARSLLESAQRSLALARTQLEVTTARQTAGVAGELDLMRATAEVERNQQLLADAESLVATGGRTLETLSGLAPTVVPPLPRDELQPVPPLEVLGAGLGDLPAVRAAERELDAAQRTTAAAGLLLVPTINAQFTERFTNATGFQGANALYNAGLTFNWRLDVPGVQGLRAQRAVEATALISAQRAQRQASDQLHSDWHKLNAALKKVQAARSQVVAARRASAIAHERSAAGVATQLDVIQAERDLFAAEAAEIQASAELASARALLAVSAGREVL